ncbi:Queuine tRNA-ribosyltransferase catalytic subunit 1 [Vitis vinifera]|uniref:Queuine tRNA-ribosyltransferase catalytic subunit 1 n=1 Tax=Vitis vinifera TaxID=29760 RepID=A0A438C3M3_VITVI|nr:Queuine tRNA-ribosyltransferase catalytic subunit 1 [Vitis vinifera]
MVSSAYCKCHALVLLLSTKKPFEKPLFSPRNNILLKTSDAMVKRNEERGVLKLKHKAMADDTRPIDPACMCLQELYKAYIHCLVTKDAMGSQLLSYHNLYYMMKLSRDLHSSIIQERFPEFVCEFLQKMFPKGDVPEWVCNAMEVAGIDISCCCAPFSSSQD